MGTTPIWANQNFYSRRSMNRPIYITCAELYNWCVDKYNTTQEGQPYHDAYGKFTDAMKAIASLFDGSLGTFVDPMSGATVEYPEICDWNDILDLYMDEYNSRLVAMPLYDNAYAYSENNDVRWWNCLLSFTGRINRLVKFLTPSYSRIMRAMVIEYNPLADYFKKVKEIGGNSPYAGILVDTEHGKTFPEVNSWTDSNNGHIDYKSTAEADSSSKPTTKNYSTTYDDSSTGRLASYTTTEGKTTNKNEIPNSAYFKDLNEEGNTGASPQAALEKELEIANAFMDLVHQFCEYVNKEVFIQIYAKG